MVLIHHCYFLPPCTSCLDDLTCSQSAALTLPSLSPDSQTALVAVSTKGHPAMTGVYETADTVEVSYENDSEVDAKGVSGKSRPIQPPPRNTYGQLEPALAVTGEEDYAVVGPSASTPFTHIAGPEYFTLEPNASSSIYSDPTDPPEQAGQQSAPTPHSNHVLDMPLHDEHERSCSPVYHTIGSSSPAFYDDPTQPKYRVSFLCVPPSSSLPTLPLSLPSPFFSLAFRASTLLCGLLD